MFGFLRLFLPIVFLSGLVAGLVAWGSHLLLTTPLILAAEVYEKGAESEAPLAAGDQDHDHDEDWAPADGWPRDLSTLGADLVIGIGFAALLIGGYVLLGAPRHWGGAIAWGLAGFLALALAPSFGLPPELPGTEAAPLIDRQIWWSGTAVATLIGLFLLTRRPRPILIPIGLCLILVPHLIGAPIPSAPGALAPADLQRQFHLASLGASLIFWLTLASAGFFFYRRWVGERPLSL